MTTEPNASLIKHTKLIYMGPIIGFVFAFVVLIVLGFIGHSLQDQSLNYLSMITGGLIGWIIGLLMTPVLQGEEEKFPEYGKALSTFVSGYLLSKFDKVFDPAAVDVMLVARVMMFASAFALGLLATYVWRAYISRSLHHQAVGH